MARSPLLFLVFFAFVANVESRVNFHFKGNLICPLDHFRYHLTMVEDDVFFDDYISHMPGLSSYYPHQYRADGQDDHDGCFLWHCDYYFEIWLKVIHTCTPYGNKKKAWIYMGQFYKESGDVWFIKDLNVTDAGENTNDVIGTKKHRGFEDDKTIVQLE